MKPHFVFPTFFLVMLTSFAFFSCAEREAFEPGYTTLAVKALGDADTVIMERVTTGGLGGKKELRTDIHVIHSRAILQPGADPKMTASVIAHLVYSNYEYPPGETPSSMLVLFTDTLDNETSYTFPMDKIMLADEFIIQTRGFYRQTIGGNRVSVEAQLDTLTLPERDNKALLFLIDSVANSQGATESMLLGYKTVPLETSAGKINALMVATTIKLGEVEYFLEWYYRGDGTDRRIIDIRLIPKV